MASDKGRCTLNLNNPTEQVKRKRGRQESLKLGGVSGECWCFTGSDEFYVIKEHKSLSHSQLGHYKKIIFPISYSALQVHPTAQQLTA